jgi:DNA-binding response OmpR family regulator
MNKTRILVVDDDPFLRKFVGVNLQARHHEVVFAENGLQALEILGQEHPDLIVLDIMMPYLDGFEVCRRVRENSAVPIIMLSAKDGQTDKLRCLELGADDFLTKPFSLSELLWRVNVLLRRAQKFNSAAGGAGFSCRDLEIDYVRQRVYLKGQEVELTKTEYNILTFLAMNAGRVINSQFILEKVWGEAYIDKYRMLWVNVSRLRRKLNDISCDVDYIHTRPGRGYLLSGRNR